MLRSPILKIHNHLLSRFPRAFSTKNWSKQFGDQIVKDGETKKKKVRSLFNNVSEKYDCMNDLMSFGIHRYWKNEFVKKLALDKMEVLDMAGGTGDIAFRILENNRSNKNVKVTVADINEQMLEVGKQSAIKRGFVSAENKENGDRIDFKLADAEKLPFRDSKFDAYTISFGLRNVSDIDKTLKEAFRVLKPGGRFLCLEFSKVQNELFARINQIYNENVIPKMGEMVAGDYAAYKYLSESIKNFLSQDELLSAIESAGFENCDYENYCNGVVAVHSGFKVND